LGDFAVTGRCQESICYLSALHRCLPGNLSKQVDAIAVLKKRGIGVMNEAVELCHRTVLPKEGTAAEIGIA
jgi:hypothetical protein